MNIRNIIARLIRSNDPKREAARMAEREQRKKTNDAVRKVTRR